MNVKHNIKHNDKQKKPFLYATRNQKISVSIDRRATAAMKFRCRPQLRAAGRVRRSPQTNKRTFCCCCCCHSAKIVQLLLCPDRPYNRATPQLHHHSCNFLSANFILFSRFCLGNGVLLPAVIESSPCFGDPLAVPLLCLLSYPPVPSKPGRPGKHPRPCAGMT